MRMTQSFFSRPLYSLTLGILLIFSYSFMASKLLIRLLASVVIPCLVIDPGFADAFSPRPESFSVLRRGMPTAALLPAELFGHASKGRP